LGERQKADMSGTVYTGGGLAGVAAAIGRSQQASDVQRGCMAQRGYILVPEDQAEIKRAEFEAAAKAVKKK